LAGRRLLFRTEQQLQALKESVAQAGSRSPIADPDRRALIKE